MKVARHWTLRLLTPPTFPAKESTKLDRRAGVGPLNIAASWIAFVTFIPLLTFVRR